MYSEGGMIDVTTGFTWAGGKVAACDGNTF